MAARVFERELCEKHGYDKYKVHLDYLEILELEEVTSAKDFDTICRPYMMERAGDKHWQYCFKNKHVDRFYWLLKPDVRVAKQ